MKVRGMIQGGLVAGWLLLLIKTIQAMVDHDLKPTWHYYSVMLQNVWQAQFNLDLLLHTLLLAGWMVYREPSKVAGLLCAAATIYMGGIFSLPYLLAAGIRSRGDLIYFVAGPGRTTGANPRQAQVSE